MTTGTLTERLIVKPIKSVLNAIFSLLAGCFILFVTGILAEKAPNLMLTIAVLVLVASLVLLRLGRHRLGFLLLPLGLLMPIVALVSKGQAEDAAAARVAAQQAQAAEVTRLAALRQSNPDAWLAEVKARQGDAAWMKGLSELRPEAWKAETARRLAAAKLEEERQAGIAAEEAARQRAEQAKLDAQRRIAEAERMKVEAARMAAQRRQALVDLMDQIASERDAMKIGRIAAALKGEGDTSWILGQCDRWAQLVAGAAGFELTPEQRKDVAALRAEAGRIQRRLLPRLRASYAKTMNQELWREDHEARVLGDRHQILQLTGISFVRNINRAEYQSRIRSDLLRMRFRQARYRWADISEYNYYDLETPGDEVLGTWNGDQFTPVR